MNSKVYAIMWCHKTDTLKYRQLCLFKDEKERRCKDFTVKEDRLVELR